MSSVKLKPNKVITTISKHIMAEAESEISKLISKKIKEIVEVERHSNKPYIFTYEDLSENKDVLEGLKARKDLFKDTNIEVRLAHNVRRRTNRRKKED